MADPALCTIMLITSESETDPDSVVHCVSWVISPDAAEGFRAAATKRLGPPASESMSTLADVRAMSRMANTVYAPGGSDASPAGD